MPTRHEAVEPTFTCEKRAEKERSRAGPRNCVAELSMERPPASVAEQRTKFLWEMQTVGSWQIVVWRLALAVTKQAFLCCSDCSCTIHPRLWSFSFGSTKWSPAFLLHIFCFAGCAAPTLSNGWWNGVGFCQQHLGPANEKLLHSTLFLPRVIQRPRTGANGDHGAGAVFNQPCWYESTEKRINSSVWLPSV